MRKMSRGSTPHYLGICVLIRDPEVNAGYNFRDSAENPGSL